MIILYQAISMAYEEGNPIFRPVLNTYYTTIMTQHLLFLSYSINFEYVFISNYEPKGGYP